MEEEREEGEGTGGSPVIGEAMAMPEARREGLMVRPEERAAAAADASALPAGGLVADVGSIPAADVDADADGTGGGAIAVGKEEAWPAADGAFDMIVDGAAPVATDIGVADRGGGAIGIEEGPAAALPS